MTSSKSGRPLIVKTNKKSVANEADGKEYHKSQNHEKRLLKTAATSKIRKSP